MYTSFEWLLTPKENLILLRSWHKIFCLEARTSPMDARVLSDLWMLDNSPPQNCKSAELNQKQKWRLIEKGGGMKQSVNNNQHRVYTASISTWNKAKTGMVIYKYLLS